MDISATEFVELLDCEAFGSVVMALGIGLALPGVSDEILDLSHLCYGKVVVVTDDSRDGKYIRTRLLSLFFRLFNEVLTGGYVYIPHSESQATLSESEFEKVVMALKLGYSDLSERGGTSPRLSDGTKPRIDCRLRRLRVVNRRLLPKQ